MKQQLQNESRTVENGTLLSIILNGKKKLLIIPFLTMILFSSLDLSTSAQGTWANVSAIAPDSSGGVMLLLSDGTVISKSFAGGSSYGNTWDKLTPDIHGSYTNGTWSTIAQMHNTRLYFSSQVLKDGRVYAAGGEYGTGNAKGETYDPLTNIWTLTPNPGKTISDANSEILEDGRVLNALVTGNLNGTDFYNPVTNTWTPGPTCLGKHNESAWVKLADNSILFVDRLTTNSERYIPSLNQWVADATVPVALYDSYGDETGAAFLLPDGRAFFLGSPGTTAYYTPSGTSSPGTWAAGPTIPNGQGTPDAAGAMMVNGKILCAVSPKPSNGGVFQSPTSFYEFDYLANAFTQIHAPSGSFTINEPSYYTNMLDLPDGSVLFSNQYSKQYYVYTPDGTPLAAGKPTINNISQTTCDSFSITGTLFNGISEGASYGDDWQMATNYPVIRLTSGTNVYYVRTYNWNSTGVQRGASPDTTKFVLPAGLPAGTYSLVVTANGISSDPISFTPIPVLSSTLNPPTICSNIAFTYTPASPVNGATFTWTRAAVTGISNAAVTDPQSIDPNEVLINTTSGALSVVYAYTITSGTCSNTQDVTVLVAPAVIASISGASTICHGDVSTLTANGEPGISYQWMKGNMNLADATNQTFDARKSGMYKVYESNVYGCTSTSSFITITVLPTPIAVITPLGNLDICQAGSVNLHATDGIGNTYQWLKGGNNIAGATDQIYTATLTGTYKVMITGSNGCIKTSKGVKVTKSCRESVAENTLAITQFSIYPNPAEDESAIQITLPGLTRVILKVYDESGKEIETLCNDYLTQGDHSIPFIAAHFATGIYIVKMTTDMEIKSEKLIVQ